MKPESAFFLRCLFLLLGITALAMLIPLAMALVLGERAMLPAFAVPSFSVLGAFLLVFFVTRKRDTLIESSKGLLLVCLTWVLSCVLGALPFYLSGHLTRFADAFFESASGFSTTGATIFTDVESLPLSLLFWRSMTHWLGGMGMVVLTVALVPLIGTGGFQLFRAEAPGPDKGRITPRITSTAKILWGIYISVTLLQILLLRAGGTDWFDAFILSFSTVASGGFASKNAGVAAYNSPWMEWVCIVFMIIAGFNFNLLYRLLQGKGSEIAKNSEARAYGAIILLTGAVCACAIFPGVLDNAASPLAAIEQSVRRALFQCVSVLSTTGFSAEDHRLWPPLAQMGIFLLMFTGGCSSSTAGGIKIIRHVILFKQSRNEIYRLLYPKGVFSIQIDGKEANKNIVYGVAGFVFLYFAVVLAATLCVSSTGVDIFSSFNIGLLTTGNIGLGIVQGSMESIIYNLPDYGKWVLSFSMIAGRLELWTIFALLYSGKLKLTHSAGAARE